MSYFYFGAIFASGIIFALTSLLLFLQRKEGERSRTLLSFLLLFSVFNYIGRIINFEENFTNIEVLPVPLLLLGVFMICTYIMYPIEVISPGWLNWKRVLSLYIPFLFLFLCYRVSLLLGVNYSSFQTIDQVRDLFPSFEVIFRIVIGLTIFVPAALLYYTPYTRKYNNTNYLWMRGYVAAIMINTTAYLLVIIDDQLWVRALYYAASVGCSLYIAYQELFVRLIRKPIQEQTSSNELDSLALGDESTVATEKEILGDPQTTTNQLLFNRLERLINRNYTWRDPDLSATELAKQLGVNRTTFREIIQQNGYSNYNVYINTKRIADFIRIMHKNQGLSHQQVFFDVGYRCKSTALRNFKEITGMIPSEYFSTKSDHDQERPTVNSDSHFPKQPETPFYKSNVPNN